MRRCKIFREGRQHADYFLSCLFLSFFWFLSLGFPPMLRQAQGGIRREIRIGVYCFVISIFFILRWEDRKWPRIVYITFGDEYIDNINYECVHVSSFIFKW